MQKLDYSDSLIKVIETLKSKEIVEFVDNIPMNQQINTQSLTPLIIESKSNFDKIESDSKEFEILSHLGADSLYQGDSIGTLLNRLIQINQAKQQKVHLFLNSQTSPFYNLHYSLISASDLATNVLFKGEGLTQLNSNDTIVFRILIEEDNLDISTYSKILSLLNELIDILKKVHEPETESSPKLVLLDSGSDANLGVKTSIGIATSLFQIFKEVWDWVLNRKFYKSKLRNAAMLENLQVMTAISEAEKSEVIDSKTAKIYKETLLRRTEDLLELKVLPKKLTEEKTEISSKKMLSEYHEIKLLESSKE